VAVARAEAAWVAGHVDDVPGLLEEAWAAATLAPSPWELGELAGWLALVGTEPDASVPLPGPFRLMVDGAWLEAADAWAEIGCPLWQALSLARSPDLGAARRSLEILDALPAPAVREAVVRDRRSRGLPVPRGPREVSRGNEAGLTSRELEVLALLVDGLSDADIATALVLSRRTVGHHVSSVLAKLGEPTRSRAVASALRRGIVPPSEPAVRP
jgi:DNA-binding CsgD family transcriptional regulator